MMRASRRILLAALVVLVIAGAAGWYFFVRDTSDPPLTLKSDSPSASTTTAPAALADLSGTWRVVAGSGDTATVAGYRVQEKFAAGVAKATANGRTPGVTGTVTVADTRVTAAAFSVDVSKLSSDKPQRDNQIRTRGLETDKFPKASFTLTSPITLPSITPGQVFKVDAVGNLTLHGVTKKVTIPLNAKESGSTFVVQGSVPIVMADYKIDPPSIGGFVSVDDNGTFEFLATLSKS